jgi:hypothetical protein
MLGPFGNLFETYRKFMLIAGLLAAVAGGIAGEVTRTKETYFSRMHSNLVNRSSGHNSPANLVRFAQQYGNLPLRFEPNVGQISGSVKFLCRDASSSLLFTKSGAILMLPVLDKHHETVKQPFAFPSRSKALVSRPGRVAVLRLGFLGTSPQAAISGVGKPQGLSNYFVGNDPTKWRANIPNFERVRYAGIYAGVDLTFYGRNRTLEFDLTVAPYASARVVRLRIEGAGRVAIGADGGVVIGTAARDVRLERPTVFQNMNGVRHAVRAEYRLTGPNEVGLKIGAYDQTQPLVIDPVLSYSTFLGGVGGSTAFAVFADSHGNAFVAGSAQDGFPTTTGVVQAGFGGNASQFNTNAFVAKLNAEGSALIYSTYLGGTIPTGASFTGDAAFGVTADVDGNAYITGTTSSTDFPVVGAFQSTLNGTNNAFVAKLNPTGTTLVYSSYLGGSGSDVAEGIALDLTGAAYVTGATSSANFPTVNAFQPVAHSSGTAFVTKIAPAGSSLAYSTYLGGSNGDSAAGIAVDSSGYAYVAGTTTSSDFPTTNGAFQTTSKAPQNVQNAFLCKLSFSGNTLSYSTLFGGSALTASAATGVTLDSQRAAYLTGWTEATNSAPSDFPTTSGVFQPTLAEGDGGIFILKINTRGQGPMDLVYSTFLGSNSPKGNGEQSTGIVVDANQNVFVTGRTPSNNFPVTPGALQPTFKGSTGGFNAFVAKLNPSANALLYSTYLGGTVDDQARAISTDPQGNLYVVGVALSTDFPTTSGVFQPTHVAPSGSGDAFVSKLVISSGIVDFTVSSPTSVSVVAGDSVSFPVTVTPVGGSLQTVSLTCSGEPVGSTCTISPSSVSLDGSHAGTATASVATHYSAIPEEYGFPDARPFWSLQCLIIVLALMLTVFTTRSKRSGLIFAVVIFLGAMLESCGGGGPGATPRGKTTLIVTGTSGEQSHSQDVELTVE